MHLVTKGRYIIRMTLELDFFFYIYTRIKSPIVHVYEKVFIVNMHV